MIPASAELKSHQRVRCYAAEVRYDTSPPNGLPPVNRLEIFGGRRERTLNQQFGNARIRRGDNAFTRVNAHSAV